MNRGRPGILALDLGTSSVKALVVDTAGHVVARHAARLETASPRPGYAEQDVDDWLDAAITASQHTLARAPDLEIQAVTVTGQMHGTVLLDRHGEPLHRAVIWTDARAEPESATLRKAMGPELATIIGGPLDSGYQASVLAWTRIHQPAVWSAIRHVLLPKDMLVFLLTGVMATDPTDAAGTGLLDVSTRDWSERIGARIGIDADWLPPILPTGTPIVPLRHDAADALGLTAGIPVIIGGGDTPASAIGADVMRRGDCLVSLGTGAQVIAPSATGDPDSQGRWCTWPAAVPPTLSADSAIETSLAVGTVLNGASTLQWLGTLLGGDVTTTQAMSEAGKVRAGANGLLFLPYLAGERCPLTDATARGAFLGLSAHHARSDMVRAAIEGIVLSLANVAGHMLGIEGPPGRITVGGGGSVSPALQQVLADVFGTEIDIPRLPDLSAYGAARIAAYTLGWITLGGQERWRPEIVATAHPSVENATRYRDLLAIFRDATEQSRSISARLVALAARTDGP